MPPADPGSRPQTSEKPPSAKPPAHLLRWTLGGLPELELFESEAQRQGALEGIGAESVNLRSFSYWGVVLLLGTVAFGASRLARFLLSYLHPPRLLMEVLQVVAMFAAFFFVLRWIHRRGMRLALREKLLAAGVAVCRGCGYALRGLPLSSARCPECGRGFDADARRLLERAT